MITKRMFAIMVGIYVVYRLLIDYLVGRYNLFITPFTLNTIFFIVVVATIVGYEWYVSRYTENMVAVERFLTNSTKALIKTFQERYNTFLWYYANDDLENAEEALNYLKSKRHQSIKAMGMATIHIRKNNLYEAKKEVEKITYPEARNVHLATIALLEEGWEEYEKLKQSIKGKNFHYALEADAAFLRGDMPEAKRLGDLAIEKTKGIARYLLLKELEKQKNNPNRKTYF